ADGGRASLGAPTRRSPVGPLGQGSLGDGSIGNGSLGQGSLGQGSLGQGGPALLARHVRIRAVHSLHPFASPIPHCPFPAPLSDCVTLV
ncbi:hypothetical protein FNH08_41710, partial [Streptomyces spongiae]|nr:hypothetical protein [Streptomyces spongiae]